MFVSKLMVDEKNANDFKMAPPSRDLLHLEKLCKDRCCPKSNDIIIVQMPFRIEYCIQNSGVSKESNDTTLLHNRQWKED